MRALALMLAGLAVAAAAAPDERSAGRRVVTLPAAVAVLEPGGGLGAVAGGAGAAWVDDRWSERLLRVDARTGRVTARVPVDGRLALAADGADVWALQSGGGYGRGLRGPLLRIDAATGRIAARIPLRTPRGDGVLGFGVLARGDRVWVWGPRDLLRIDARGGRVVDAIAVGDERGEATGFALLGDQPAVTTADGHLVRFDPRTGAEAAAVTLPLSAPSLQSAGAARAIVTAGGSVAAVDPATGALLWRRRLGFRVGTVIAAGGALWAHGGNVRDPGDRIWQLDPRTGAARASALLPAFGSMAMAAVDRALWVTTSSGRLVVVPRPG